ncbi:MAG: hypothetical protein U0N90_01665 [Blautia sp.]
MKMKRVAAFGIGTVMMVSMCVPAMAADGTTDKAYTLTFMADPTLVSSGFVYEPVNFTIPAGTPETTTLGEILEDNNVPFQGSTSYISGLQCAEAATFSLTDAQKANFPEAAFDTRIMVDPTSDAGKDGWLSEKEFTGYAGWMMYVDNQTSVADSSQPYGSYYYTLGSSIADLEKYGILADDNVVLEMFFSFDMGADIGMSDSYLPTSIVETDTYTTYDWSGPSEVHTAISKANRTELVKALAANKTSPSYADGLSVLKNLSSTQDEVDFSTVMLNE